MSTTSDNEIMAVLLLSFLPGFATGLISAVWLPWFGAIGLGVLVFFLAFVFWGVVGGR